MGPPPAKKLRTDFATSANATPSSSSAKPAKPNKQLDEFMQVMSGADPVASSSSQSGPVRDQGWGAKGKAKEVTPVPEPVAAPEEVAEEDEDDDAAWLRKRQEQASKKSELDDELATAEEPPSRVVDTVEQPAAPVVEAESSDPSVSSYTSVYANSSAERRRSSHHANLASLCPQPRFHHYGRRPLGTLCTIRYHRRVPSSSVIHHLATTRYGLHHVH